MIPGNVNWFQTSICGERDGRLVYGSKARVVVIDLHSLAFIASAKAHEGRPGVTCAKWLSFNRGTGAGVVVTAGSDKSVKIWGLHPKVNRLQQTHTFKVGDEATALDVSCSEVVAVGDKAGVLHLRSAQGKDLGTKRFDRSISSLAYLTATDKAAWLAVGQQDGKICVLDGLTPVFQWKGPHSAAVQALSWRSTQRKGLYLASSGLDKKFVIWRIFEKQEGGTFAYQTWQLKLPQALQKEKGAAQSGHNRVWNTVQWCPIMGSEDTLYSTANAASVLLCWDLAATLSKWEEEEVPERGCAVEPQQLQGHSRPIFSFAVVNGPVPFLFSLSMERRAIKWALRTHKKLDVLPTVNGLRCCIAFGATSLVYGDKTIVIWPLPSWQVESATPQQQQQQVKEIWGKISSPLTSLAVQDEIIAFGTQDGDIGTAAKKQGSARHDTTIRYSSGAQALYVGWVAPGRLLALCTATCVIVDIETGDVHDVTKTVASGLEETSFQQGCLFASSFVVCSGGRRAGFTYDDGTLVHRFAHSHSQVSSSCDVHSADGTTRLATGGVDGTVSVANVFSSSSDRSVALAHTKRVTSVCWSASGTQLCSSGVDSKVVLWNGSSSDLNALSVVSCEHPVSRAVFSPWREDLMYVVDDQTIRAIFTSTAQPYTGSGKKRKAEHAADDSRPQKVQHVASGDWFRGVNARDKSPLEGNAAAAAEVFSALLSAGTEDTMRQCVSSGASRELPAEARAALLAISGDQTGAAQLMIESDPAAAAMWVALCNGQCVDTWQRTLAAWRAALPTADPAQHALMELCHGNGSPAAKVLADAKSFKGLATLHRACGEGAEQARQLVAATLRDDLPPATAADVMVALGRDDEALALLAKSTKVSDLKQALQVKQTVPLADRYAVRWLLGEDSTVSAPPDGVGGLHCAMQARRALAMDRASYVASVKEPANCARELAEWMERVKDVAPRKVHHVVALAVSWLLDVPFEEGSEAAVLQAAR